MKTIASNLSAATFTLMMAVTANAANTVAVNMKETLTCTEKGSAPEVKLKVETVYSTVEFEKGGSINGPTKRTIELKVRHHTARSAIRSPDLTRVPNDKLSSAFLKDNDAGADGAEYKKKSGFYDAQKNQFPVEFLRLKASIPKKSRVRTSEFAASHYSINLVLPEVRLQENSFTASGYIDYYLEGSKPSTAFTIGLTELACTRSQVQVEEKSCLTKEEKVEMAEIEAELKAAIKENPACQEAYGAASCISPFSDKVLGYLKSKTTECK